jgi:hypothetical protein
MEPGPIDTYTPGITEATEVGSSHSLENCSYRKVNRSMRLASAKVSNVSVFRCV